MDKRSKRIYVLWAIALTLLITGALFCWLVVVPVWQVRRLIDDLEAGACMRLDVAAKGLGSPPEAVRKLELYIRIPERFAGNKHHAVRLLGHCGADAVPVLIGALNGRYGSDWITAAHALADMKDIAVPRLLELLEHEEPRLRGRAAFAMGWTGREMSRHVPAVARLLDDPDPGVRLHAITALGVWGFEARSEAPRIARFLKDEHTGIRRKAAGALVYMQSGDEEVIAAIKEGLSDADRRVRLNCINALMRMISEYRDMRMAVESLTRDPDPDVSAAAKQTLEKMDRGRAAQGKRQ